MKNNKNTRNTTKFQQLILGYSSVTGIYVVGLKDTGTGFYRYLLLSMLVESISQLL